MAEIQFITQAKEYIANLSKRNRIIIGSTIGALLIGVVVLIASLSGEKEELAVLFSNLEQGDASKIVEKLKEQEIKYELRDGGATIMVDKTKVYDTRLKMASEGLPEDSNVGYELFDKSNLGMSEFVQKLNYRRALEGELSRTIAAMDEIKKARVHIVIPEKALFIKDQKKPTASVTLHLKSGRSLNKISVEGIQNLIANSVEGMNTDDVRIIDQKAQILSEPPIDENSVAGLTDAQHAQQRRAEQYLANKVQTLLESVLGPGNSSVRVNAELDFTRIEETKTTFDPEGQVVRSEQNILDKNQSADSLSYPYVSQNKQTNNSIQNYEVSKSEERIQHEVGAVKRLSVAAIINGTTKVVEKDGIKALEYIPRSEEEMEKFRELVSNAVGYNNVRNDQISVLNIPFDHSYEEDELNDYMLGPWYKNPDNQKIIFLLAAILLTISIMYKILQSKQVKERLRIAFGLPDKISVEDDFEDQEEEEPLEELEFDDEELLLLPAELPEQLLLTGETDEHSLVNDDFDEEAQSLGLANQARASLDDDDLSEDALMKLEMKNKVESFMNERPQEAVKLIRLLMAQDADVRNLV